MKKVRFERIKITNFCGIKQFDSALYDRTIVKGRNAVGKSTVKKAIQYVLNVRDENGKEISGIRPHDENGIDIDGLVTSVELIVSADGAENALRKDYYQKKNKKGDYTGEDATEYYIDDVKKGTKKAYDEFVHTIIPNEVCVNANVLIEKDTAGIRAILSSFSKHTIDDIVAENPQFQQIAGKVKANSISDIKKALREKINGSKNKSGLNDELKRIGVQIEVEESKKRDIDVAELELHRNVIKEQIADIEAKEADISKQFEEYQRLSDGVLELKFELNGLQQKANFDLEKKRSEIRTELNTLDNQKKDITRQIFLNNQDIQRAERSIERGQEEIKICRDEWSRITKLEFDENSLNCTYCGQPLPQDKQEELTRNFANKKADDLESVTMRGNEWKAQIDKDKSELEQLKAVLKENKAEELNILEAIKGLEQSLEKLPVSIDISDTEEYKAIQSQIAEKEAAMKKMNSADTIRQDLKESKSELQSQLTEVNTQIALSEENAKIDDHIAELQKKQREVSQQIADVEHELDLLKDYERKTAEALERDVNEYFEFATVKMFDTYQNGEIKDVCMFLHKGTSYDRNLNHGARMLTEIDICKAFQKLYEVECPIIIEDSESLDSDRIPQIDNQLIMLKRTDDDSLIIEEVR